MTKEEEHEGTCKKTPGALTKLGINLEGGRGFGRDDHKNGEKKPITGNE